MDGRCSHRESISESSNLSKYQYLKRQSIREWYFSSRRLKLMVYLKKGRHCGLMIPIG
jgi:hypothetical protein